MLVALFASSLSAIPDRPSHGYFYFQSFNDGDWSKSWLQTSAANFTGEWQTQTGDPPEAISNEKLLFMMSPEASYGISTKLPVPLKLHDQTFIIQYETRFQTIPECSGAYIKLFSDPDFDSSNLSNLTRYALIFGPDKCGSSHEIHFNFNHRSPKTGLYEEKTLIDPPFPKTDALNHLYTLIVRPNNSFEILIDTISVKQGSLLSDFSPPVNPPALIDDPGDKKPADWADVSRIPDPSAKKPVDWDDSQPEYIVNPEQANPPDNWLVDEPPLIPDPRAVKPEQWDDDIHGDWFPPTITNPKCEFARGCGRYDPPLIKNPLFKGKWKAPIIPNPAYKGPWAPRKIPNPDYFEDLHPHNFEPIVAAGFEFWAADKDIGFNNVFIGTDEAVLKKWNNEHFLAKRAAQVEAQKQLWIENHTVDEIEEVHEVKGSFTNIVDILKGFFEEYDEVPIVLAAGAALLLIAVAACACGFAIGSALSRRRVSQEKREEPQPVKKEEPGDEKTEEK
jgi:calnexin